MKAIPIKDQNRLRTLRKQIQKAIDTDRDNRMAAKDDLEFVAVDGKQWPDQIRAERTAEGRPCLTINKMPVFIDQVVGDQRMNRPAIKVIPVDSKADPEVAKILSGWIKHVQQISRSDVAIDHGFEHAVACGYGAWRVTTKYVSDDSNDQEAYIEKIDNALAVFWSKHTEYDCSDAKECFIISDMDRDEYKEEYGFEPMGFKSGGDAYIEDWSSEDTVRVVECFSKKYTKKTLFVLEDGTTTFALEEGQKSVKSREVNSYVIMWELLSGDRILKTQEWVGKKYIPVIPVWGKELNVAGKRVVRSLIRNAKDPQRMFNYWESTDTETVTMQPKSPYILTPKQIAGHEQQWQNAHKANYPYLLANPDKDAPGWPHRQAPPQVSSAMVEKLRDCDQEIRDTMGLQKATLGMQSNERSGEALREQKKEGSVGTFAFPDNLSRSLEHTGRILIDIAPALLDTERIVRLGLDDGEYEFTKVNVEGVDGEIFNDLSIGIYDVVATVGPSFTTQRTEARKSMQDFMQYYPQAATVVGDLYAKAMDWPGAEKLAQRLEFLLPAELKEKIAADEAKRAGEEVSPPAESPAPPPDPLMEMKLQEEQIKLQEAQIKLEQEKVELEKAKVELEVLVNSSKDNLKKMIEEVISEDSTEEKANVEG